MKAKYKTWTKLAALAQPGQGTQVFQIPLIDPKGLVAPAKSGDVVEVKSSLEVTTQEATRNALVWVDIFVSQDSEAESPASSDYDVGGQAGTNIAPAQHHYNFERGGHVTIPAGNSGPWYLTYVVWWDPDPGMLPGKIEQSWDYGSMGCVVTPKAEIRTVS